MPQNGVQLRLEDLFSSSDFTEILKNISAGWREEQGISDDFPTLQDFYLTQDELVLLFPSPDALQTLPFSIPLEDLSDILSESLAHPLYPDHKKQPGSRAAFCTYDITISVPPGTDHLKPP